MPSGCEKWNVERSPPWDLHPLEVYMAKECTTVFRRIADILSDNKKMPYCQVIHLIRC